MSFVQMPEWSKGYDLRSYDESFTGSNPVLDTHFVLCAHHRLGTDNMDKKKDGGNITRKPIA